jgi:hypothetical protein
MPPVDLTVPFDDFFREVMQHCAVCGRPALHLRHVTWVCTSPETGRGLTLALGICDRCQRQPDWWTRLDQAYRRRYGFDLDGSVVVRRNRF